MRTDRYIRINVHRKKTTSEYLQVKPKFGPRSYHSDQLGTERKSIWRQVNRKNATTIQKWLKFSRFENPIFPSVKREKTTSE